MDCNLHCKYCFRDNKRIDKVPEFTPDMIECLKNLSPEKCKIATATGGEPFLRFDKVKEYFSYVHKDIPKKIISNCTLLTQEIVDYINENNIELQVSHDGSITKFLRGVDIFEDGIGVKKNHILEEETEEEKEFVKTFLNNEKSFENNENINEYKKKKKYKNMHKKFN